MITRRSITLLLAATVSIFAFGASSASAVEIGKRCVTSGGSTNATYVPSDASFIVPFSGIITAWGTNFPSSGGPYPLQLITVSGEAPNFTVTAIADIQSFSIGDFTYAARINVKAGDRIASTGTPLTCIETGVAIYPFSGVVTIGQAFATGPGAPNSTSSLWARLEPDADSDGFGDETQDLCPQSAQFQIICPTPKLSVLRVPYAKGFQAFATSDVATTMTVTGSVKLPGKRKATTFKSKTFSVGPGNLTKVTLKLPSSVNKALKSLSKSKKLKVSFSAVADGVLTDSTKKFSVSFPGTKR